MIVDLEKKYDLFVISHSQTKNLENHLQDKGIKNYFKGVFGVDKLLSLKPDPRALDTVFSQYKRIDKNKIIICSASGSLDAITILHRELPELVFVLTERGGFFKREQIQYLGMDKYVELVPKVNQENFYRRIADCVAGIYFDYKGHLGRFATDCAILGIPCIGTKITDRQNFLWPYLTLDYFSQGFKLPELIDDIRMLSCDKKYYITYAETMVKTFGHKESKKRFDKILEYFGYDCN